MQRAKPHPDYTIWGQMIHRCSNSTAKRYHRYGGRGISVCDRWRHSFADFIADMGPRPSPSHTIDRIDNDGNYEPGNCRWATDAEQSRNRSDNRILTHDGKSLCMTDWAILLNIPLGTLAMRLRLNWSVEKSLTTPVHAKKSTQQITYNGETLSLKEWSKRTGIKVATIHYRINLAGWDVDKALSTPTESDKVPKRYRKP